MLCGWESNPQLPLRVVRLTAGCNAILLTAHQNLSPNATGPQTVSDLGSLFFDALLRLKMSLRPYPDARLPCGVAVAGVKGASWRWVFITFNGIAGSKSCQGFSCGIKSSLTRVLPEPPNNEKAHISSAGLFQFNRKIDLRPLTVSTQ